MHSPYTRPSASITTHMPHTGISKSPLSVVIVSRETLVPRLVTVMVALATAAPLGSATEPRIVETVNCANALEAANRYSRTDRERYISTSVQSVCCYSKHRRPRCQELFVPPLSSTPISCKVSSMH